MSMHSWNLGGSRAARLSLALAVSAGAAAAQDSASDQRGSMILEEIVVTSERQDRSIMNTSTSVVVLDSEALARMAGLEGGNDLLGRIPNITTTGTSNFAPAVRGVDGTGAAQGADAFLAGTRPRLNLQLDGRPASYNEVVFGDVGIWDVQQIEVLRGPQSALQGRNAIAGTLAIKTKDPTFKREGSVRVAGGNYQNREYAAAFSAPLGNDEYAFRIAAQHKSSESFVHMAPFAGLADPAEYEATTVRGKLLLQPKRFDGFSTLLTLNYSKARAPQAESVRMPFDEHQSSVAAMPAFQPRTMSAVLASTLNVSDSLAFANTLAYTDINVKRIAPAGTGNVDIDGDELVIEPTMRFTAADGRLRGLAGIYFFDASQDEFIDLFGGGTFDDSTRTAAVFGELTYALSEQFDVTLGARYEEEKRQREGTLAFFTIDLDETYEVFLPKLVLSWHPSQQLTLGTVVGRGYNGGGAGFTYSPPFAAYTFEPEYVWNYEIFARQSLAGGRVTLIANLFLSKYDDMQLPFNLGPLSAVIRNADKAETRGLELSLRAKLTRRLEASAGLGVLDTEVKEYPDSGIEGNELPRSSGLSGNFGFSYVHERGFDASLDARYSGSYYSDLSNDRRGEVDPHWIANAQLGQRLFGNTRLFGYVSNLFDENNAIYLSAPGVYNTANILRPRTYGIGIQVDF